MSLTGSKRTRTKVQCFCIKCNGTLVDPRTKKSHMSRRIINYQKVKKGRISDRVLKHLLSDDDNDDLSGNSDNDDQATDLEESKDEDFENDDYEVVNFASPDFNDDEPKLPPNLINDSFTWIILWIFQFQQRYKLSNVAIDSLFKFLSLFLSTVDANKFKSFPSSLHMAKKKMKLL